MVNALPLITLLIILLFNIAFSECSSANSRNEKIIPVKSYTNQTGLLSNNINDIVQDEKGFLWVATNKGLSRFDSSGFEHFVSDKSKSDAIPSNEVGFMMNLPNQELWLSVLNVGISIMDKNTFKFNSIKNIKSPLFDLPNKNLFGMAYDHNNNIWLSLFGTGIYQWNIEQQSFIKHLPKNKNPWLNSEKTFEIFIDSTNTLWVCTIDSRVYWYNIDSGSYKEFLFTKEGEDPFSNPIYGFAESKSGEIFAGGYSGVYKFNPEKQSFDELISKERIAQLHDKKRTSVRRLFVDSKDNLWVGTTKSLLQYSKGSLFSTKFIEDGLVKDTNWSIRSVIEDYDGNIWIATESYGLMKLSSDWERYAIHPRQGKSFKPIKSAFLYKQNLWVSNPSSKISLYSLEKLQLSFQKELLLDLGSSDVPVDEILQEEQGFIWVISVKGIHRVNLQSGEVKKIQTESGLQLVGVTQITKLKNELLYFATYDGGIGYINKNDLKANFIEQDLLKGSKVIQIYDGLDNSVWFVTNNKIISFDSNKNTLKVLFSIPKNESISNLYIESDTNNVWVVKDGGLFTLQWSGIKLTNQSSRFVNILPAIKFRKIKQIKNNIITIESVDNGLIEINITNSKYQTYTTENGLPSNTIVQTFFNQGETIVVTEAGIAVHNPLFVEKQTPRPRIVIDKISLGNNILPPNERKNLILDYNYGSISFDAALLSYTDSSTFEYQYRLKGATNDWASTGSDDKFAFLNLDGGKYNFQVKGRSNYGQWSQVVQFPFVVKSPPWKTMWAYLLYATIAALFLSWFLYLYKRKVLYEHEISKKQAQKELADAASKAKSDFLARVSHEVRTPLNGVLGMSELLLDTQVDEEQKIYADTIHASGKHLLSIINDILDLSKIEAGKLELEQLPFDLLLLVDEVCSSFISQTRQKQLMFSYCFSHEVQRNRIGDAIRLKQILFNLLSNAFKFTKEGEVFIKINNEEGSNSVVISVQDTGIGIDEKLVQSLFEPFVQADSAITRKFGGTGLGLAICKQLTEKMNGTVHVDSKPNSGTVFTVKIPLKIDSLVAKSDHEKPSQSNVCLLLEKSHVRQSIVEYCKLLSLSYSKEINDKTRCVFIDEKLISNAEFNHVLEEAKNQNLKIIVLGFDEQFYPEHLKALNIHPIILPLPLTFKKMQALCLEGYSINELVHKKPEVTKHQRALKLLVVEDSEINQQVSIEMLEKMGHLVDVVDNAEEGLTTLQRNNYDMLFLDYHLPGMDGFELLQKWQNTKQIPVVMVTADLTDDVLIKAQNHHITEVVAKPFSQQTLSNIIKKTMGL